MGSSKKQTIGYRYFMGLHFGLCLGPVDALLAIRGGDRNAWVGTVTQSERITINAPELWGGEKKEGGIAGELDVMMGEPDQQPNDYLVSQLGEPMPAFRGMLSVVFRKGMVGAMNPYPKPWKFQVRRLLKGWHDDVCWYPATASVPLRLITGWNHNVGQRVILHGSFAQPELCTREMAETMGYDYTPTNDYFWFWRPNESGLGYIKHGGQQDYQAVNELIARGWSYNQTALLKYISGALHMVLITPTSDPPQSPQGVEWIAQGYSTTVLGPAWLWGQPLGTEHIAPVSEYGMNPAHITYEALTNPDWGLGYPPGVIDDASFRAAADVFHAEGLGLCGQWARQDTIEGFIQEVMNHAGAVLGQDPRTGLFRLLPIRGGYDVETLPEFRRGLNVLAVESFERAAITETTNEVTVEYTDVETGKTGSVTVQHLANIQAQGGVAPQTVRYPLIPTMDLAQRIAARDLQAKSLPLCRVRLRVDRSGYGLLPGQVVRWSDSKLGIVDMPMRVLEVDYGNLTAGAIRLTLAEDVFGMPATTYLGQQDSGWQEPDTSAKPSPAVAALEVPYVAIHRNEGASATEAIAAGSGFLGMLAVKPSGVSYGYAVYTRVGGGQFEQTGTGEWAAGGVLADALELGDTAVTISDVQVADEIVPGALAMLGSGEDAELVRISAVDGTDLTIGRGVGDTVARAWPVGTRLWVLDGSLAVASTEYVEGETVEGRASTTASGQSLPVDSSPGASVTMAARASRPYPPGRLRIDGDAEPTAVAGEFTVTWAHRDRLLQADQLVDQEAASVGPEPTTRYALRLLDDAGTLLVEKLDIDGTAATVDLAYTGDVTLQLYAISDNGPSWQRHVRTFAYTADAATENTIDAPTYNPEENVTIIDGGEVTP